MRDVLHRNAHSAKQLRSGRRGALSRNCFRATTTVRTATTAGNAPPALDAARNLKRRRDGMLCRQCESAIPRKIGRGAVTPAHVWGSERIRDLLCTRCGTILAAEDIAQRLLQKQSQLALFGLAGSGPLLLEPAQPKDA